MNSVAVAAGEKEHGEVRPGYAIGFDFFGRAPFEKLAYVRLDGLDDVASFRSLADAGFLTILELGEGEGEVSGAGRLKFRVLRRGHAERRMSWGGLLHLVGSP